MLTVALISAVLSAAPASRPLREAVVVGNNHPLPGETYDVLRYADDDAIRYAELFEEMGISTALLTVPDGDTATRYRARAERAQRPTRAELLEALDDVRDRFEAAEGRPRELYFVFSGHGSVTASRAYLHLFDLPFSRTDLFEHVLRAIPAERVHIVIDSCHSYFLVNARGERVAAETDTENVDRYPQAGFLLSTSDRREVQEWDGYRAGVFSYQVLGALRGAADVDGDGIITYPEVHAYVLSANLAVENPSARIHPFVRRPAVRGDALVDLTDQPPAAKTVVGPALAGHFYVMDDERGRVLDAHKPGGASLALLLPAERPLYVRRGAETFRVVSSTTGTAALVAPEPSVTAAHSKGSPEDDFRTHLFKTPLTEDFVRGLDAVTRRFAWSRARLTSKEVWYEDPLSVTLLSTGAAAVVLGAVATGLFVDARATASGSLTLGPGESEDAFRDRVRAQDDAAERSTVWQGVMIGGYAAGAALLIGGIVRALDVGPDDAEVGLTVVSGGRNVALVGRF